MGCLVADKLARAAHTEPSHHPQQLRTPSGAHVAHVAGLVLGAVAPQLAEQVDDLAVRAALLDQARHGVAAFAAAFRASDLEQVDLADQIAEGDGAVAGQGISFDLTAELLGREGGHVG